MALEIRRDASIKVRVISTLVMAFALVAQPFYGLVSTEIAKAQDGGGEASGVIITQEFVTNDGASNPSAVKSGYDGISVGFLTENFDTVKAVTVTLNRDKANPIVKHASSGVIEIINNNKSRAELTTPFVIKEGSFKEIDDTQYWERPALAVWSQDSRPSSATITIIEEDGGRAEATITPLTEANGVTYESIAPNPSLTQSNFNTNVSGDYKGINVGFNAKDMGFVTNITVDLYKGDKKLVTNTGTEKLHELMNMGETSLSTPFYTQGIATDEYWTFDTYNWTTSDKPTKAVVTVVGANGTKSIEISPLAEPNGWTFESLVPEKPVTTEKEAIRGDTSTGENQPGWMFNRDVRNTTPYVFSNSNPAIGSGSIYVKPITNTVIGNADKFIAEHFLLTPVQEVKSISYDFKLGNGSSDTKANEFYMNLYANYPTSSPTKFYDCRYEVVPTIGYINQYTTVNFDLSEEQRVTTSTSSPSLPAACPKTPADMPTGSVIRMYSLNVGGTSGSDTGLSGYLDNVVVNTKSTITTYDFEAETPPAVPTNLHFTSPALACNAYTNSGSITANWSAVQGAMQYLYHTEYNGSVYEEVKDSASHSGGFPTEATYTFKVKALSATGVESAWSESCSVTYDKTPPTSTNNLKPFVSGTIDAVQNVTDSVKAASGKLRIFRAANDMPYASANNVPIDANGNVSYTVDTSKLTDGKYTAKFTSWDAAGNASVQETIFTVDNVKPTVTVKSESVGSQTDRNFQNVSFKLFDAYKIDKASINGTVKDLSNNNYSDLNGVKPGSFGAVEGENTLVVYDIAGNATEYKFTLDTAAPNGTFTYSNNNGKAVTANDVTVTLSTNEVVEALWGWSAQGDNKTFTKVHDANGKFTVEIEDLAGNKSTLRYEVKRIDRTAPVINGIVANVLYNRAVTYTVTEQSIDQIIVDGISYSQNNAPYTITGDGVHTVKVIDKAGNEAQIGFKIDQTTPVASITSHNNNDVISGQVVLVGQVDDANPMNTHFKITGPNGYAKTDTKKDGRTEHQFAWDVSALPNGTYTVQFETRDQAGNKAAVSTKKINLAVDNPQPIVNGANFNTHSGADYKGINVGFNLEAFKTVTGVTVDLYDEEGNLLASNTHNQALLDLITGGVKQLSTPFITDAGTYIEEYWNTGTRTWTAAGKPVKAIVTVTGTNNADVTVTEDDELTSLAEPNGWTYESVLPVAVFVPGPVDGDTNEQPNGSNNGSQAGGGEQAAGSENANSVSFVTGSTFSPLQTPASIFFAQVNGNEGDAITEDDDTAVLGTQSENNNNSDVKGTSDTVAAIEATDEGWKFLGVSWYWLVLLVVALGSAWYLLARRRNQDA